MTTESPRPDQIQANVAAALSRLRGELAPTTPSVEGIVPDPEASKANESLSEPLRDTNSTLSAPDVSMALNLSKLSSKSEHSDNFFPRMTAMNQTDQPDLLTSVGTSSLSNTSEAGVEALHRRRRLRNRLVAAGVIIIALAGFWYWSSGAGNGPVPIIAADTTPEKVKPAEEGGLNVPNQDVAILNGGISAATNQGETVLPAPEQPAAPPVPTTDTSDSISPAPLAESGGVPSVSAPAVDAIPAAPAPEVGAGTSEAVPSAPETTTTITPSVPAAPTTAPEAQTAAATPIPAPAPATGTSRIQLAAVRTEAAARKEWSRLQKANPAQLGGLSLFVERFNKNSNEVYYRLQAGPLSSKKAKQICAQLKQKNQPCLVAN